MVGSIELHTDTDLVTLADGNQGVVTLTLSNQSSVVDAYTLSIPDLDAAWYTLTPQQVALFPQTQALVTLELCPTATETIVAGEYPFHVVCRSRDQPDELAQVPLRLQVAAHSEITLDLQPQRIVARRGTFQVGLTHRGNAPRTVVLQPRDPDADLVFSFSLAEIIPQRAPAGPAAGPVGATLDADSVARDQPAGTQPAFPADIAAEWIPPTPGIDQGRLELTLPPATTVQIPLTVTPRRRRWMGPDITFAFEVVATPPGVEWDPAETQRVAGELVYWPYLAPGALLPLALRRVLLLGFPLLALLLVLALLLRGSGDPPVQLNYGATATAAIGAIQTAQAAATQTALADAATQTARAAAQQTADAAATQTARAGATQTAQAGATQTALAAVHATAAAAALTAVATLTPAGPPTIVSFDFTPVPGRQDQVTASWVVNGAERVTLNNVVVLPTGTQVISATQDQTWTLVATNIRGSVTLSRGILLVRPPEILSFTASTTTVAPGGVVTLRWRTLRATRLTINGQLVSGPDGNLPVTPSVTTEYLLSAESILGQTVSRLTVTVPGHPGPLALNAPP